MINYQLVFFVPESALEVVKTAIFSTGAGRQGDYECCCFQTQGLGQFRPLSGANPYIGQSNVLEKVNEWRVEVLCNDTNIKEAVVALKRSHPYEEVAFSVTQLVDID